MSQFRARLFFPILRGAERCLPLEVLRRLTGVVAVMRAVVHTLLKGVPEPRRMPACFSLDRPVPIRRLYRVNPYENRMLQVFPDRLNERRWLSRCEALGLERVKQTLAAGGPVVLGFVHFGPYELLRNWMRAHGLPAATHVGGRSPVRSTLSRRQDRLALFPDVPTVFYEDQLAEAVRSVRRGIPLLVALDMPATREVWVPLAHGSRFLMPTGALRLALRHEGDLFPCSLTYLGRWRYRLEFGEPVPRALLANGREAEAGVHLLNQLIPILRRHPEQCRKELLRRFADEPAGSAAPIKR